MGETSAGRRAAYAARAGEHLLAHGLDASSLRALAAACGTSDRMLLYYFADKGDLVSAALETLGERFAVILTDAGAGGDRRSVADLAALLCAERVRPFLLLWLDLTLRAARGDAFYAEIGGRMADGFVAWAGAALGAGTRAEAVRAIAMVDGFILLEMVGRGALVDEALG